MFMNQLIKYITAFYRLSRIKVIVADYFILLTGVSIMSTENKVALPYLIIATLISLSIHCYSFIVNDLEDAEDDALDDKKKLRNPISSGYITYNQGFIILQLTSIPALIASFAFGGINAFMVAFAAILTGHLYSWKVVRFKAYPILDIVSHSFALAGFQPILFNSFTGGTFSSSFWLVYIGVTLISVGGALYNQLRDYDVDVQSNLNNTTIFFGKRLSKALFILAYLLGFVLNFAAIIQYIKK